MSRIPQDTQSGNPERESSQSGRADIHFWGKFAKLFIIERKWGAAGMAEFLKIPTRIPSWYY
jgi:hypothetical protein